MPPEAVIGVKDVTLVFLVSALEAMAWFAVTGGKTLNVQFF